MSARFVAAFLLCLGVGFCVPGQPIGVAAAAKKKKEEPPPPPPPPPPVVAPPPPVVPEPPKEAPPARDLKLEQLLNVKNLPPADAMSKGTRSHAIFPDQTIPLRFSHKKHLALDVACDSCHPNALTSTSSKDRLIPSEEDCAVCHPIDRADPLKKSSGAPSACATCHVGVPSEPSPDGKTDPKRIEAMVARIVIPEPNLKFNHKQHLDKQIPCSTCHGDLSKVDLATRAQLPTMAVCLTCHDNRTASPAKPAPGSTEPPSPADSKPTHWTSRAGRGPSPRCATCHLQQPDGLLVTRFSSGQLAPSGLVRGDTHGPDFKRNHRQPAQNDPDYCATCHKQSFCQSCHNGVVRPLDLHGGDYVSRHSIDARRNTPDCSSCHRRQTFCLGCHERLGVVAHSTLPANPPISPFFPGTQRRFHPDGWASPVAGASHHRWEAQRNMRTCVSCHREETCMDCHSALPGGRFVIGRSPHGNEFVTSGRCQSLLSRNARMCLKCHREAQLICQ
ncbi:MAG TPA: cytochrome c3 family protein [Pseudomonadota bacterium]|nr:cytochrome c3 family protein [Pseudomonadota bacterium]